MRPDPRLLRTDRPPPPRPRREPTTQPRLPHARAHQNPPRPTDRDLPRQTTQQRQDQQRSDPQPQTPPRPTRLPPSPRPQQRPDHDLLDIGAVGDLGFSDPRRARLDPEPTQAGRRAGTQDVSCPASLEVSLFNALHAGAVPASQTPNASQTERARPARWTRSAVFDLAVL